MSRRLTFVLLCAALGVLAACASHASPAAQDTRAGAAAPGHTVVRTFHAYGADGTLAVRVDDVASGSCWTTSIAAPAKGVYRCISDNAILDPCFAPPHPATPVQVACVADPWSGAVVLTVSRALPEQGDVGARRPWALLLDNGARCTAATGTVPAVHGVNLTYHCRTGWDAAPQDTSAATVTADYGDARAGVLRQVNVATIWRV